MIGKTISHYRITDKLGAGGMGEVYLATDEVLGRRVAVKLMRLEVLSHPAGKARFLREARAVAALNHPGIAVLYEVGEAEDVPFLVMEYVEGIILKDALAAGPLATDRLLDFATQVAAALEHAHKRGILHRDIKSTNIVITRDGTAKLLDFGLAKATDESDETRSMLTEPGTWVGTLHYCPPEVLSGRAAERRSDIYSLGVVLYEVVSEIMSALDVSVDSSDLERIAPPETRQLEAYEHYAQGRIKLSEMGKHSLEEARQHLERAVSLDSRYGIAFSALGATHAMRFIHLTNPDDLARAQSYLERAIEIDPELGEPYPWLCYIYSRLGKVEEALRVGHRGVERQPDLIHSHYFLGAAYLIFAQVDAAHYQPAVDHLFDAVQVEPQHEPAWLCLGWAALINGAYDHAERFFEKALEVEQGKAPKSIKFLGAELGLGNVWSRRCSWESSLNLYNRSLLAYD